MRKKIVAIVGGTKQVEGGWMPWVALVENGRVSGEWVNLNTQPYATEEEARAAANRMAEQCAEEVAVKGSDKLHKDAMAVARWN